MANEYLVRYLTVGYCFFIFAACTTLLRCVSNEILVRRWPMQTSATLSLTPPATMHRTVQNILESMPVPSIRPR